MENVGWLMLCLVILLIFIVVPLVFISEKNKKVQDEKDIMYDRDNNKPAL